MRDIRVRAGIDPDPAKQDVWKRLDAAIGRKTPEPHEVKRYDGRGGIDFMKGM